MSEKAMILLGAVLLVLGVSGCTRTETSSKTVARKPLDTKKPLAPQLFPTPATNNAWFHVITTSDELKFNAKLSQTDDVIDFDLSRTIPEVGQDPCGCCSGSTRLWAFPFGDALSNGGDGDGSRTGGLTSGIGHRDRFASYGTGTIG